jgi:ribosomal protein S18 acetylase RimI-like enzyme
MTDPLTYAEGRATEAEVLEHLWRCDAAFSPPLSQRVDMAQYARQLCAKAERFEAWAGGTLVGFVAGYCNDEARRTAYISNVSVLPAWTGHGIAGRLVDLFVAHARAKGFGRIDLDVNRGAVAAIALYTRRGFMVSTPGDADLTMTLVLGAEPGRADPSSP